MKSPVSLASLCVAILLSFPQWAHGLDLFGKPAVSTTKAPTTSTGLPSSEGPPDPNGPLQLETCIQHPEAAYDEYCTLDHTHVTMAFIEWIEAPSPVCRIVFKGPSDLGIVSSQHALSNSFRGISTNVALCQSLVSTISSDRVVRVYIRIDKWDGYPSGKIFKVMFLPKLD